MENQTNYPEGIVKLGDIPLNLTSMSVDLGVSVPHLSFVFSGKRNPSTKLSNRIAKHLGISMDELFNLLERRRNSTTAVVS